MDDSLDARWGKPWREHLPLVFLPPAFVTWAASLEGPAHSELEPVAARLVKAHMLRSARALWIEAQQGGANTTSALEAFTALLEECRRAVEDLESAAKEVRARYDAMEPPGWTTFRKRAVIEQEERITKGTKVDLRFVLMEATASVDGALNQARAKVLDPVFETDVAEGRATIMTFARKQKTP